MPRTPAARHRRTHSNEEIVHPEAMHLLAKELAHPLPPSHFISFITATSGGRNADVEGVRSCRAPYMTDSPIRFATILHKHKVEHLPPTTTEAKLQKSACAKETQ
ncbi:uncharacterized protein LOC144048401 [Vanacampus margaritifer]